MREQAGCLPVRGQAPSIQILLVTSRYSGEWIAPKGSVEPGELPEQTACREAEEEAGVRGRIVRRLGRFAYPRGGQPAVIEVFELQVTEELQHWAESLQRRRRWFSLPEALQEVRRPEVIAMLRALANGE